MLLTFFPLGLLAGEGDSYAAGLGREERFCAGFLALEVPLQEDASLLEDQREGDGGAELGIFTFAANISRVEWKVRGRYGCC